MDNRFQTLWDEAARRAGTASLFAFGCPLKLFFHFALWQNTDVFAATLQSGESGTGQFQDLIIF